MQTRDISNMVAAMAPVLRDFVARSVAPLVDRTSLLETEVAALRGELRQRDADMAALVAAEVAKLPPVQAKEIDTLELAAVVADEVRTAVAAIPVPQDGKDADPVSAAEVAALLKADLEAPLLAIVRDAIAAIPAPVAGKDADMAKVERLVSAEIARQVGEIPPPVDGKSVDPGEVARLVAAEVEKAVAAIPAPVDGKDADPATIERMVAAEVAKIPAPVDGKDADPDVTAGLVAAAVEKAVAAIRVPEDGKSVTVDDLRPVIAEAVERSVAAIPPAKDGIGLAGAVIDREGRLVLTLSDGGLKDLGIVVGKNADMEALADVIMREVGKIPRPRDGTDGVGWDDMEVIQDGPRSVILRFTRGETVKDFAVHLPGIIDCGVWREGEFKSGDGVTYSGSFWIAQRDTTGKPEVSPDWRLAVKRGRDGKNTETVKILPATVKLPDSDAA